MTIAEREVVQLTSGDSALGCGEGDQGRIGIVRREYVDAAMGNHNAHARFRRLERCESARHEVDERTLGHPRRTDHSDPRPHLNRGFVLDHVHVGRLACLKRARAKTVAVLSGS